jgi:hypothetical protein
MKQLLLIAILVGAAACGGKSNPAPAPEPAPDPDSVGLGSEGCGEDAPATAEQCECHGWQVVGDIGDGQVKCPDGTKEMSRIEYGIEGGVCCAPDAPAAE